MTDILLIGDATETMRARMAAQFTIHELADMADPLDWLKAHGANIRYVATNGHDGIKSEYVEALPNLKVISCYGVGYDAIDTAQAVSRGIWVTHTPNVLNAEVATTALMLMLACYRNLLADDAYVRSGKWQTDGNAPLTRTADNRTVGIVGLGRIGQAIADKVKTLLLGIEKDSSAAATKVKEKLKISGYIPTSESDFSHTLPLLRSAGVTPSFEFRY